MKNDLLYSQPENIFTTISLKNRLMMPIELDIYPTKYDNKLFMITRVRPGYHESMLVNNVECIAQQLKRRYLKGKNSFYLIEYRCKRREEWWQWSFSFYQEELKSYYNYKLSNSKIIKLKKLLNLSE